MQELLCLGSAGARAPRENPSPGHLAPPPGRGQAEAIPGCQPLGGGARTWPGEERHGQTQPWSGISRQGYGDELRLLTIFWAGDRHGAWGLPQVGLARGSKGH